MTNLSTCEGDRARDGKIRLAIVVSHPIQYFVPLYRALAGCGSVELRVFYCSRIGLDAYRDPDMGVELAWRMDLLGGYDSAFLRGAESIKSLAWGDIDNPDIGAALQEFCPDAVIINGYARKPMLRALYWCKRHRVRAMMMSDSTMDATPPGLRRLLKRTALPRLLAMYGAMLTMSECSEAYFKGYGVPAERLFRVPTMMDDVFWQARERREDLRRDMRGRMCLSDEDIVLLYVGKLHPRKRVGDIIDAMARLRHLPLRLVVVGDGAGRAALAAASVAAGVAATFVGFINIDGLAEYYCSGDVLVHPAEFEPFGMIAIEAAIVGLPMIHSDRVGAIGATSIARPGDNTMVYPCGNVDALAGAIERLATDAKTRARMGESSLCISEDHRGGKSVAGVLAAIEYCLGQQPGRHRSEPAALARRMNAP